MSTSDESPDETDEFEDQPEPVLLDRLLTRTALYALPDPEPLIDNVLDLGTTALLYGYRSTAKSFIALDWALSVATGRNWQGRATDPRKVLYVAAEGAFGYKGRVAAWETGWQDKVDDDAFRLYPKPLNMMRAPDVLNLCALVEWEGFDFVVLDTLARCMVGGDENGAEDAGVVVDAMTRVRDCTPQERGVVLGVHHAGKDKKTLRGSSAFESNVDTVYFTSREEGTPWISLARTKRKDGPENDRHLLELDPIEGSNSCVIKSSHGQSHEVGTAGAAATLRSIMSHNFGPIGASSAQLRQIAVDDGPMAKTSFYRAVSELVKSGWMINTGTDQRPFYSMTDE